MHSEGGKKNTIWATFLLDCRTIEYTRPSTSSQYSVSSYIYLYMAALGLSQNFHFWQPPPSFPKRPCSIVFCLWISPRLTIIPLKFYFLPPPDPCPHLCHSFSSCLLPIPLCQLPVLAVWAEASGLGRMGCGISVSACLCNRRRRTSGPLSADQHRCRWQVKSSPVTKLRGSG